MGACGADCGITRIRDREKQAALVLAERLHPDRVWRRLAAREPAVSFDALVAIGHHLEDLLPVRAIVRARELGDGGDSVYLLAGLHAPSLCEIADGAPLDPATDLPRHETYLRVAFSPFARLVTLQEVRMAATRVPPAGASSASSLQIVEEPMAGVEDRRLRTMVKGLQGALRKKSLTLLDMAFLAQPLEGGPQTAFAASFHEEPRLWSLLFDPAPPTTVRATLVPL